MMRLVDALRGRFVPVLAAVLLGIGMSLALALALALPASALAQDLVDTGRSCALTLSYEHQGTPVEGIEVKVFRVGDMYAAGDFALVGPFAACADEVSASRSQTSAQWLQQAYALADFAMNESVAPGWEQTSPASGIVELGDLPSGLYLVVSDPLVQQTPTGEYVYSTQPTLLSLPTAAGSGWSYAAYVRPKLSVQDSTREIAVNKLWVDEGHEGERPDEVQVTLLCNGQAYDQVTLSDDNDWSHVWTVLSWADVWTLREDDVPEGYVATVRHSGDDLVLVNTHVPDEPTPPGGPDDPDRPTPPTEPSEPATPDTPTPPGDPSVPGTTQGATPPTFSLPQLGDNGVWQVIAAVALVGIALACVGALLRSGHEGE